MEHKSDVVEKRIKPGIIRRRAKETPKEEAKPEAPVSPQAAAASAAAPSAPQAEVKRTRKTKAPPPQAVEEASVAEAPAVAAAPEAPVPSTGEAPPRGASAEEGIKGPRTLPEGPPVGTIIKLPQAKKKGPEGPVILRAPENKSLVTVPPPEEEDDKKVRPKKGPKKEKMNEDELGLEGIGRVGTLSQIARISFRGQADRVFQPVRTGKRKRSKLKVPTRRAPAAAMKAAKRVIRMEETITVGDLAQQLGVKGGEIIKKLMALGTMVTLNQAIDFETAVVLAGEYQWEVKKVSFQEDDYLKGREDLPDELVLRAPVVTVMGHVDHGKTSLLDAVRSTQVAAGEAGGITQHIGAYRVKLGEGRELTFLDTPGHEAFTAMRARGASVTDIVVLVVAADDGVMPQTVEAINHAKAAEVPIIVAVNKIDKPDAKPENVMRQLSEHGLLSEAWGGDTQFVQVSAKTKQGMDSLLESSFLQAEILELKANPKKPAKGVIVEARLERGRGPVATALIQEGTLRLGDTVVSGIAFGRVRGMINDRGEAVEQAGPGYPVEIQGLNEVPQVSEPIQALEDEHAAREIVDHRLQKQRDQKMAAGGKMSLEDLFSKVQKGEAKELLLIVKADVQGSVEAFSEALKKLGTDKVRVNILHSGVGAITESDVMLASASDGVILGFHIRPDVKARELAEQEGVEVKVYEVIYDAVEDVKKALEGLLEPTLQEKYLGRAEIRQVFNISKVGTVAGCYVQDGKIVRNAQVRLLRDNVILFTGRLGSLKRFKDDQREVEQGYECGLGIDGYNDIKPGDVVECFQIETIKTKLNP
jgi:translation initiation factor IF-2